MIVYRILLAIDLAAAAILLLFFAWGVSDGTVSSFNITLWLVVLAIPALILWGGLHYGARRQYLPAGAILALLAAPSVLAGLVLLALIIVQPSFH